MRHLFLALCFLLPNFASAETTIQKELLAAAKKDIAGQASPFAGAMKAFHDSMLENYGGRFAEESLEISVASVNSTIFRAPAKYCDGYADAAGKPLPEDTERDSPKAVYRICDRDEPATFIVTATFAASTSGTAEQEGVVFKLERNTHFHLLAKKDAGYFPEPSEIKVNEKTISTKITKLEF